MATKEYREKAPDGSEVRFTGPENASREQVLAAAKRAYEIKLAASAQAPAPAAPQAAAPQAAISLSGVGQFAADVGLEGGGAALGRAVGTVGGPVGAAIGGGVGAMAGQSAAQLRRMSQGQQESFNVREAIGAFPGGAISLPGFIQAGLKRLIAGAGMNTAVDAAQALIAGRDITMEGLALAAAGGSVGELPMAIRSMNRTSAELAAAQAGINITNRKQLVDSMTNSINDGFVFIPSVEQRKFKNSALEMLAGRDELANMQIVNNQVNANRLVGEEIVIPKGINPKYDSDLVKDGMPRPSPELNSNFLSSQIQLAYAPYEDATRLLPGKRGAASLLDPSTMASIPESQLMGGEELISEIKKKRESIKNLYGLANGDSGKRTEYLERARAVRDEVESLEDTLQDLAEKSGQKDLVTRLKAARKYLAKMYAYDSALNAQRGEIDMRNLASQMDNGVPLDGNAAKIAKFANTADNYAKGASKARPMGLQGAGVRSGAVSVAASPMTGSLRNMILSPEYQLENALPSPYKPFRTQVVPTFADELMRLSASTAGRNAPPSDQRQ
jgi:hypothetical protein